MLQLLEGFALSPGHEEEQFKDIGLVKKQIILFSSGLKQLGTFFNKNLKTLNDLQGPEVRWHTVLMSSSNWRKDECHLTSTWGDFLTSVQPHVVVKLE